MTLVKFPLLLPRPQFPQVQHGSSEAELTRSLLEADALTVSSPPGHSGSGLPWSLRFMKRRRDSSLALLTFNLTKEGGGLPWLPAHPTLAGVGEVGRGLNLNDDFLEVGHIKFFLTFIHYSSAIWGKAMPVGWKKTIIIKLLYVSIYSLFLNQTKFYIWNDGPNRALLGASPIL